MIGNLCFSRCQIDLAIEKLTTLNISATDPLASIKFTGHHFHQTHRFRNQNPLIQSMILWYPKFKCPSYQHWVLSVTEYPRLKYLFAFLTLDYKFHVMTFHLFVLFKSFSVDRTFPLIKAQQKKNGFFLSNGHSPQICQNGELLVRMCRGESHFSQKSPLANVGESGECRQMYRVQAK